MAESKRMVSDSVEAREAIRRWVELATRLNWTRVPSIQGPQSVRHQPFTPIRSQNATRCAAEVFRAALRGALNIKGTGEARWSVVMSPKRTLVYILHRCSPRYRPSFDA